MWFVLILLMVATLAIYSYMSIKPSKVNDDEGDYYAECARTELKPSEVKIVTRPARRKVAVKKAPAKKKPAKKAARKR